MSIKNRRNIIVISGTPGVGKSSVSALLSLKGFFVLNLNKYILEKGFYFGYDYSRESVIIDEEILQRELEKEITSISSNTIIIEGHTTDLIPSKFVNLIFVLRCNPKVLFNRLKISRAYSLKKIQENVEAEIMEDCLFTMKEKFPKVPIIEIDSTFQSPEAISKIILNKLP